MNPPKVTDPKIWEMAYGFAFNWEENETLIEQMAEELAEIISQAIEAEREDILRVIDQGLYLDGSYIETSDDEIYLISQSIRNRSNTTTERNEG